MFRNSYSLIKSISFARALRNWGVFETVADLRLEDCTEVLTHLKTAANIPLNVTIWNRPKIDKLVKLTKKRKAQYVVLNGLANGGFLFGVLLIVPTISFNSNKALIACAVTLSVATGSWMYRNSVSMGRRDTHVSDFFADHLSQEQKDAISAALFKFKEQRTKLYTVVNYEVMQCLPTLSWLAENWFLLFTENDSDRYLLWLDGRPPKGILYFLQPTTDIQREDNINNEQRLTTETKKYNRNLRKYDLQGRYLSNTKRTEVLLSKLNDLFPIDLLTGERALNSDRTARLLAIQYIVKNPGFWTMNLENKQVSPLDFADHKERLRVIFSKISRQSSTLSNSSKRPGAQLTKDFLALKDRTLENWLNEILDK